MTFRRRTYPELVENLLTYITGGISAEAYPFPPGDSLVHPLNKPPVSRIISVYGSYNGEPYRFKDGEDYELADNTLIWTDEGHQPDPGTVVHVNYYSGPADAEIDDLYVGSVLRTLTEATALEIARFYAQLEAVYEAAYIDMAGGRALDNVVALLGIDRVRGGHPVGEVVFTRSQNVVGAITIPAGTRVMTGDGQVEYETTQPVTMLKGQNTIRVSLRDLEANDPLLADTLTVLPQPIAGIASVTNPTPTHIETRDETDDQLRIRAKNFLHGSERATLSAIQHAVNRQDPDVAVDVEEDSTTPGYLTITLHADTTSPDLEQRILSAINDARPAGVLVRQPQQQAPKRIDLELLLTSASGALAQDLRAAQRTIQEQITAYFDQLPASDNGSINKIIGMVLGVPPVEDVRVISAMVDGNNVLDQTSGVLELAGILTVLGNLSMADPQLPTQLEITILYPEAVATPPVETIRESIRQRLSTFNDANNSDLPDSPTPADLEARSVSYDKLLDALPASVSSFDITFVLLQETGLAHTLTSGAAAYALTPFERLTLGTVQFEPEADA